jgi:predicted Zn-ribbon and HTH transcriptional regulator
MGPVETGRHRFDIAEVVRRHRSALEACGELSVAQKRVLSAIERCRTAALGGHVDTCRSCGHEHPAYNSCRNRHCPKCQALAQEQWISARSERILPVPHFHVVFTLPSELRGLGHYRPKALFDALFSAASATLMELGRSRLGAELGVTMVLHTWTRDLRFHPHVHCIVTAGGLGLDGERWVKSSQKYLFPVKVMGALMRGKVMAALSRLHAQGVFEGYEDFTTPGGFGRLMRKLAKTDWVVYAKKPFRRADHVLRYLGRYTHRVAIANSRLVDVDEEHVTFRTKEGKTVTLTAVEFLRRFVQHVLPAGFVKIRHYGLLAGANVEGKLAVARRLLEARKAPLPEAEPMSASGERVDLSDWAGALLALTGRDVSRCPKCGAEVVRRAVPRAAEREPP